METPTLTPAQMQRLTRARTLLLLDHPFFGNLTCKLPNVLHPNPKATATTDGTALKWTPAYVDKLTDPELMGVTAAMVMHCANGHTWRRGNRDMGEWNIACDKAIHGILRECGLTLPKDAIYPPAGEPNRAAEAYYNGPSATEPEDEGTAPAPGGEEPGDGASGGEDGQGAGNGDPGGCGGVEDAPEGVDAAEQAAEWRVAVAQAAAAAEACGNMPGTLARTVAEIVNPVVPWEVYLRDFVERTARNDYSWARPNPRYFSGGIVMPSLVSEELPAVVVVIDISGSITPKIQATFGAETSAVLGCYNTTIHLLYVDTRVAHTEELSRADLPFTPKLIRGGGTDFAPAFRWVEEQGITPACLIYLTDLDGPCKHPEPEYPVLWVSTRRDSAPFGQVVKLEA
jgi:predicted metal-dependent peptidase